MGSRRGTFALLVTTATFVSFAAPAGAAHSWGNFHWARTGNPFTLQLGDNVTSAWDAYLKTTSGDWSQAAVLDTAVVPGGTDARKCRATAGRVEVCNARYGFNRWLGVASIWASGDHITQATVKVNDSYFETSTYNTPAWRNMVMCQEVGHTLGLDHVDEDFDNVNMGTCMDYTDDPDGGAGGASEVDLSNEHPNDHDYDQLDAIYLHTDGTATVASVDDESGGSGNGRRGGGSQGGDSQAEWGRAIRHDGDGRPSLFVREDRGQRVFTFVVWAR